MPIITIPRSNVTVDEVSEILRAGLGSRYKVLPSVASHVHHESSGHPNSILVKRHWWEQALVEIVAGISETEIHIGGAASVTPPGFLINRAGIVRKVQHVLEQSSVLAGR
jgi:hypothetical protein